MVRASASVVLVALAVTAAAAGQQIWWWRDETLRSELHLSRKQVVQLEREYDSTLLERRAARRAVDRAEADLQTALTLGVLTDMEAEAMAERVSDARRRRNVLRTTMLFRMYRALTPAQREALMAKGRERFR